MLQRAASWIRRHPVRTVVYALLLAAAVWGGLTVRGILRGERNGLVTAVARSSFVRGWVEREFRVRYAVKEVGILPDCGLTVYLKGASAELIGVASGGLEEARVCVSLSGELRGINVGTREIRLDSVRFEWPKSISGESFAWSDGNGALVKVARFAVAPTTLSGSARDLQVLSLLTLNSASGTLAAVPGTSVAVTRAEARGASIVVDEAALRAAPARFAAAAAPLAAMATAALPFPARWSATAKQLSTRALWIAAALLLALKAFLTRAPASPRWRVVAILAPFPVAAFLAFTYSWQVILLAAPLVAATLWALAYRRAKEWQQRWEPAIVDVVSVLLAMPLLALLSWPLVPTLRLPKVERLSVGRFDLADTEGVVRTAQCTPLDSVRVTISEASLKNLRVGIDGGLLRSVDAERVSAAGVLHTQALESLRAIRYLPPQWTRNSSTPFCADVTVAHTGAAALPPLRCAGAPGFGLRAAIDYGDRRARFAAAWVGGSLPFTASGSANLEGARIDEVSTAAGSAIQVAGVSGQVAWPSQITASVSVRDIRSSSAKVEQVALTVSSPAVCQTGPFSVAASIGRVRSSVAGRPVDLDGVTVNFARPSSSRIEASAHWAEMAVGGPVVLDIPHADLRLDGFTSTQQIPHALRGSVSFSTIRLGAAAPVTFDADLWSGEWTLGRQQVRARQAVTSRLPASIAMEVEASGRLTSLSAPLRANASGLVRIPDLALNIAPARLDLRDLRIGGAWDALTGAAPVQIGSGWNIIHTPELPSGITFNEVSKLRLATSGEITEIPALPSVLPALPKISRETTFRFQGTAESLLFSLAGGEEIRIQDLASRDLKASLPGLQFQYAEMDTAASVKRGDKSFPVSLHTRLSDAATGTTVFEPLSARIDSSPETLRLHLKALDTAALLDKVGIALDGVMPRATVSTLAAEASFAADKLTGLDLEGSVAAGPLVVGAGCQIQANAPMAFRFSAPVFPKATVSITSPGIEANCHDAKQRVLLALDTSADLTLAPAPASPVVSKIADAAAGLRDHAAHANRIFGDPAFIGLPVRWDLAIGGGSIPISVKPDNLALDLNAAIHRLDFGPQTVAGDLQFTARAAIADDHLLFDWIPAGHIDVLGQRLQWNTPVTLAIASTLRAGSSGELFDSAYYETLGGPRPAGTARIALGYGAALQANSAYGGSLFFGTVSGLGQAAVRWEPTAARIAAFGRFSFADVEAGAVALPDAYLEDRLDGEGRFRTANFIVDRTLVPQLMADASRVSSLDDIDLSLRVQSARGNPRLPGFAQSASRLTLKPANDLLRLVFDQLKLQAPPRAFRYRNMSLDFQVEQGRVRTAPPLLVLNGVDIQGVEGLGVDAKIRVFLGGHGDKTGPRLRDLIYALQRTMEP